MMIQPQIQKKFKNNLLKKIYQFMITLQKIKIQNHYLLVALLKGNKHKWIIYLFKMIHQKIMTLNHQVLLLILKHYQNKKLLMQTIQLNIFLKLPYKNKKQLIYLIIKIVQMNQLKKIDLLNKKLFKLFKEHLLIKILKIEVALWVYLNKKH